MKLTYNFIILKIKRNESKKDEKVAGNGVWNYKIDDPMWVGFSYLECRGIVKAGSQIFIDPKF